MPNPARRDRKRLTTAPVGPSQLVVIGRGLGGAIAANLTTKHPEITSLIMIDPQPPTLGLLEAPRWTHMLPVRLLARDRFNPSEALSSRSVDKLFLLPANASTPAYVTKAAPPSTTVRGTVLGEGETAAALRQFVNRHRERNP